MLETKIHFWQKIIVGNDVLYIKIILKNKILKLIYQKIILKKILFFFDYCIFSLINKNIIFMISILSLKFVWKKNKKINK